MTSPSDDMEVVLWRRPALAKMATQMDQLHIVGP